MIKTTYRLETAAGWNADFAETIANKTGIECRREYRPTCFNKYALTLTARGFDQDAALTLLILACTQHAETSKYRTLVCEKYLNA